MKAKVKATGKIVDGIPIYYGSEGKGYLDVPVDHDIFDRYDLEEVELLEQSSLPDGLEEAADKYASDSTGFIDMTAYNAFKAGAEWMKAKMMEGAVEGYVNYYEDSGGILMAEAQVGCPYHNGDKVKIIIVKEEQK